MQNIHDHLYKLLGISLQIAESSSTPDENNTEHLNECFCNKLKEQPNYQALAEHCHSCRKNLLHQSFSQNELTWEICPLGLFHAILPIQKEDLTVAQLSLGPLRTKQDKIPKEIKDTALRKLYQKISYFSEERLNSLKHLLPLIVFPVDIYATEDDDLAELITNYIKKNIHQELRLSALCETFHISKNRLYKIIYESKGMTVNEYILKQRISAAKLLLRESKDDLGTISRKLGFKTSSYFSNFFKKYTGTTPKEYRKQKQ